MQFISQTQFVEILRNMKGASFANLVTKTMPKLLKIGKDGRALPQKLQGIQRHAVRNGMLGAQYENIVENQREREGNDEEFQALPLWNGKGKHINAYLVEHEDTKKKYLSFYPRHVEGEVKTEISSWFVDGKEVQISEIQNWLPVGGESSRQETEVKIPWRVFAIDSIVSIKFNGETYMIAR